MSGRNLRSRRHLLDVSLKLSDVLSDDLRVDNVSLGVDLGMGGGREGDILVDGALVKSLSAVVEELLSKLLGLE